MTSKRQLERDIEKAADSLAVESGWLPLKFEYVGRSWPDKIYLGPHNAHFIVEWKRPGELPRAQQFARIETLRDLDQHVYVLSDLVTFSRVLAHEGAWPAPTQVLSLSP